VELPQRKPPPVQRSERFEQTVNQPQTIGVFKHLHL
jgi:hypothetical protein